MAGWLQTHNVAKYDLEHLTVLPPPRSAENTCPPLPRLCDAGNGAWVCVW